MAKKEDRQEEDDKVEFPELRNPSLISKDYFENTTTHGLTRIYSARNFYIRWFWLILFLVVFGLLIRSLANLVIKLTKNDIVTSVQTRFSNGMAFPAITFCNENPFRRQEIGKLLNVTDQNITIIKELEVELIKRLGHMNKSNLYKLSHAREVFLMDIRHGCLFSRQTCDIRKDFQLSTSIMHGNCYTFPSLNRKQKKSESGAGLFKVLNIDQDSYLPMGEMQVAAGALVHIHNQKELLNEVSAIHLQPGTLTDIKIEKRIIKRLQSPYPDKCAGLGILGTRFEGQPFSYTTHVCYFLCYLDAQNEYCGYVTPTYRSSYPELYAHFKVMTNVSQYDCIQRFDQQYQRDEVACNCPPPCYEEQFRVTVSSSMWPPLNKAAEFLSNLKAAYAKEKMFSNWTVDTIYRNILATDIYFKDFTVETVEQKPAYGLDDFASDLGGQLGLWIGASVFSAFELGAYFMNLITYWVFWRKRKKSFDIHSREK